MTMASPTPPVHLVTNPVRLPTSQGSFACSTYRHESSETLHIVLQIGDPRAADVLVRVHSECLTGDVFGSFRCDCGEQLDRSLELIGHAGNGVLIYLRDHEGRGIGLADKLRAYALQEDGLDTVDANTHLGHQADERDYAAAVGILQFLGTQTLRLLTNNPAKVHALRSAGFGVDPVPLPATPTPDNYSYLQTKRDRMGHLLEITEQ